MERTRQAGKIRFTGLAERFASDTTHAMATRATVPLPRDALACVAGIFGDVASESGEP